MKYRTFFDIHMSRMTDVHKTYGGLLGEIFDEKLFIYEK